MFLFILATAFRLTAYAAWAIPDWVRAGIPNWVLAVIVWMRAAIPDWALYLWDLGLMVFLFLVFLIMWLVYLWTSYEENECVKAMHAAAKKIPPQSN
jgi:hypothetical protein